MLLAYKVELTNKRVTVCKAPNKRNLEGIGNIISECIAEKLFPGFEAVTFTIVISLAVLKFNSVDFKKEVHR